MLDPARCSVALSSSFLGVKLAYVSIEYIVERVPHICYLVMSSVLGKEYRNVIPRAFLALECGAILYASQGSVVGFNGDAIVNAANTGCLGGGGGDGAISHAGGQPLYDARLALPLVNEAKQWRCATGDAKITIGGELNAKHCIHAVGPNYGVQLGMGKSMEEVDDLLLGAYRSSMSRAKENNIQIIAFSLISAGVFKGPKTMEEVLEIGIEACVRGSYEGLEEVHLVGYTETEMNTLCELVLRRGGQDN